MAEPEARRHLGKGAHEDVVEVATEDPGAEPHRLGGQAHVGDLETGRVLLLLEDEPLVLADGEGKLALAFGHPRPHAGPAHDHT